ncbi:hypothetical protein EIP91_010282 [Steccherinum ochraceum]|uniref:F-box domain-containing protein n=1 Tax=Steccherinum ochraceum TaxID=92696 RepID=A0A4V2MX34_9APHY|nr:hypothetical protein EIP91_010282 [Steccherinum ochraceum]
MAMGDETQAVSGLPFPAELIDYVLQPLSDNKKTLSLVSQVSTQFKDFAQRRLFRRIFLNVQSGGTDGEDRVAKYNSFLDATPHVHDYVQDIYILGNIGITIDIRVLRAIIDKHSFLKALTLRQVGLTQDGDVPSPMPLQRPHALQVTLFNCITLRVFAGMLLNSLPSPYNLDLMNFITFPEQGPSEFSKIIQAPRDFRIISGSNFRFMLDFDDTSAIEIFDLDAYTQAIGDIEVISTFMTTNLQRVHHLRLNVWHISEREFQFRDLSSACPSLQTLHIDFQGPASRNALRDMTSMAASQLRVVTQLIESANATRLTTLVFALLLLDNPPKDGPFGLDEQWFALGHAVDRIPNLSSLRLRLSRSFGRMETVKDARKAGGPIRGAVRDCLARIFSSRRDILQFE